MKTYVRFFGYLLHCCNENVPFDQFLLHLDSLLSSSADETEKLEAVLSEVNSVYLNLDNSFCQCFRRNFLKLLSKFE